MCNCNDKYDKEKIKAKAQIFANTVREFVSLCKKPDGSYYYCTLNHAIANNYIIVELISYSDSDTNHQSH